MYLQDAGLGADAAGCRLSVDASWLDATGADGGVACLGGSLVAARFVTPAGGTFGASGVVNASGAVAPHVVIEPDVATPPTGETDRGEVPGDSADKSPADANPAAGEPTTGAHGKSLAETRGRDNQDNNDSNQDLGRQSLQAQDCHRDHCGTPQDRRQLLDYSINDAFPSWHNAPRRRESLL